MPKKIYDIKPPKVARKIEKELKEFLGDSKPKKRNARHKKEETSLFWPVFVAILVVILGVGTYLFFKLPKAEVSIWPKVETLSYKQTIKADKTVSLIDVTKAVIPAEYFKTVKTNSQDFPATGNASNEGKASGTITVYNKYDPPAPLTFKEGTRFLSDSGKLFVALQKVVIPAAKKVGGKITPGSVQIKVQAMEGGSDYNIAPSNFSVPGLKGTAYYYSIYAVSTVAMEGGYAGKVKKVTDQDLQEAKDVLITKTTSDAMADLKSQIPAEYTLLENAALSSVTEASSKTKAGTIADNFNYQVTITASALAFKRADIDQFVKDYINSQISEEKTLLDGSMKVEYSSSVVDISGGKATLNLDFSTGVYQDVNKNSLMLSMMGQNKDQMDQTIQSSLGEGILKSEISFWPFWVKAAPNSQKAIDIELKFE